MTILLGALWFLNDLNVCAELEIFNSKNLIEDDTTYYNAWIKNAVTPYKLFQWVNLVLQ